MFQRKRKRKRSPTLAGRLTENVKAVAIFLTIVTFSMPSHDSRRRRQPNSFSKESCLTFLITGSVSGMAYIKQPELFESSVSSHCSSSKSSDNSNNNNNNNGSTSEFNGIRPGRSYGSRRQRQYRNSTFIQFDLVSVSIFATNGNQWPADWLNAPLI